MHHCRSEHGSLSGVPGTICLTSQLLCAPFEFLAPLLGHELAHTVQLARAGDHSIEYLEAEAWEASRAALRGQRYLIKGNGREALAAAGLYRTDDAREFMETFGIDPLQIPKGNTAKIDPLTFEKILDLMLDKFKNEDDFVIDAHGDKNGFGIDIIKGEQGQATTANLATLPKILDLRSEFTKAGDNLKELQRIVRDKTLDGNPVCGYTGQQPEDRSRNHSTEEFSKSTERNRDCTGGQ